MNLKTTENWLVLGILLAVTGALAALILGYFNMLTEEPIKAAKVRGANQALSVVLPAFDNDPIANSYTIKAENGMEITYYGALREGQLVGVAGSASTNKGYAGAIKVMAGLNPETGAILGIETPDGIRSAVTVTEHNETPGLGSKVCNRTDVKTIVTVFDNKPKSALAGNSVLDQFAGRLPSKPEWKVTKDGGDVTYVTGATISSRAVTDAIYWVSVTYADNEAAIVAAIGGGAQ